MVIKQRYSCTMKIALLIGVTLCFIIGIFPAPFVALVKLSVTPLVSEVQIPQRFSTLVRLPSFSSA